ncbi:Transposon TX1 uncharacterized 149 kDa protein [Vitis vinifera]|uniref:Transposon TX1 uncharacterized 149 kDa protein n=1 Tax=Vitis vinifera TaxID=29760 RepID=A0A438HNK7_VITVI|nr:Transposon TX1 uncharacterized 149 kDa protein [Vitis vinifera]
MPVVENLEVCLSSLSQSPESSSTPSCGLALPMSSPFGPDLPSSVSHSQSPMENRAEVQFASSNLMFESVNPSKSKPILPKEVSNLVTVSQGGRVDAPQVYETCWNWFGGLGSVRFLHENNQLECQGKQKRWSVTEGLWVVFGRSGIRNGLLFWCAGLQVGFLIIWDSKKLRSEEVVIGSFLVSVKFALDGYGPLWLSAVYGPNNPLLRKDFWVELLDIFDLSFPLWCVSGDFNVIKRSSEKLGSSSLTSSMKDFDGFIRECELLNPLLRNASFTWSNMQESPVCKRLNHFLYSNEWGQFFPQSLQEAFPRRTSDHWPIVLDTNPFKWGPTPFRFENMWLQHSNFKESFRSWWRGFQGNGWEGHKFMRRLQFVKANLKEWNKVSFGELNERKKNILNDLANFDAIEQVGGLTSELLVQRTLRKGELEELILREEIHWRQKGRVKWVKEGDCNSKFFHKVANGRRNRKFIKVLENESGLVLNNSERIIEEILLYFEKFNASPTGESWSVEGLDWSPISEKSASRLDSPFTEEGISKAIFQLDRDKAPGPDGFTITVFQDCWDVIKEDLVRVFAEFHRSGIINQSTNTSFIVLLPKKSLTKKISDFRPISLITSLYKIIAKVLSGRLRGVLHETIHSTQGAFVQGRQILDMVLIANEIVDEKRRSEEEGVVFKIDFEKAYDHVSWDFLDHVLEKKGFSPRWRKLMSGCLSMVSYVVLVNRNTKEWVKAFRGLRQDDPLSPFLFTFVADVLSRMLLRAEERNLLEGFRVGRTKTRVSHLQFADDTIFFSNTREEELQILKSLLLAKLLDCKASSWPILYLGLPLGGNPKACGFWDPVIERISRRLDGWGIGIWEDFSKEFRSLREMVVELDGHIVVLGRLLHKSFRSSKFTRFVVGDRERIRFWEDLWWGDQPLGSQYSRLFRVVSDKNILISSILGSTRPFSWNFNFRHNLSDSEIEDLEGLMRSLDGLHLSPSVSDARS